MGELASNTGSQFPLVEYVRRSGETSVIGQTKWLPNIPCTGFQQRLLQLNQPHVSFIEPAETPYMCHIVLTLTLSAELVDFGEKG